MIASTGLTLVAAPDLAAGQPAASAAPGSEEVSHVKPEDYGQRWTIRFQMIPALVKDPLFK